MASFTSPTSVVQITKNGVFYTTVGNNVRFVRFKTVACIDGYSAEHSMFQRDSKAVVFKDVSGTDVLYIDKNDFADYDFVRLSDEVIAAWKRFWGHPSASASD